MRSRAPSHSSRRTCSTRRPTRAFGAGNGNDPRTPHGRTTVGGPASSSGDVAARRTHGEMRDVPDTAAAGDQRRGRSGGDPPVHLQRLGRGARGPAPPRRSDQVARSRDGSRPGRAPGHDQGARSLLGDGLRLADLREAVRGVAALRHPDRWRRHPLHPRPLDARGRAAADRHARLARLDDRAAQDHRPADRSRRATVPTPRTRSTSSSRPCRATASPGSRPRPVGTRSASPAPGSSS